MKSFVEKQPCYWDTSAVLSILIEDAHSLQVHQILKNTGVRLISSLVVAEALGVLSRVRHKMAESKKNEFLEDVESGEWSLSQFNPTVANLATLSSKHKLRGADLWHFSVAWEIRQEIAELEMVTFDQELRRAALDKGFLYQRNK